MPLQPSRSTAVAQREACASPPGRATPWLGTGTAERTLAALADLRGFLARQERLVGGGDRHPVQGSLAGSTRSGQAGLLALRDDLRLHAPTASLPSAGAAGRSIDHLALGDGAATAVRVVVERRLGDHDAYVVETVTDAATG